MLFLVMSSPHPSKPEDVKNARLEFRSWIADLTSKDKVVCFYPKVGRGSIVVFDVSSNDELNKLLTQWLNVSSQEVGANPCGRLAGQAQGLPLPQVIEKIRLNIVPGSFDIYPLATPSEAEELLK